MHYVPFFSFAVAVIQTSKNPKDTYTQKGADSSILETITVDVRDSCVYLITLPDVSSNTRGERLYDIDAMCRPCRRDAALTIHYIYRKLS